MIWTSAMDEAIETMWRDGLTLHAIAEAMNQAAGTSLSRSAIQGRLRRLAQGKRPVRLTRQTYLVPVKVQVAFSRSKPLGVPAELLDLDPDGCRWGVSEDAEHPHRHRFCNYPRMKDRAYCRAHWLISIGQRA